MYKDFLGSELNIGDRISVAMERCGRVFLIETIIVNFTPCFVKFEPTSHNWYRDRAKFTQVVRLPKGGELK